MKRIYTYDELEAIAWKRDDRDFESLRTAESIIAEEFGYWPDPYDPAPQWLVELYA